MINTARSRIIETALHLFYEQGYLATGINQIISDSQVAKATFYHHFSSKENLCVAYLQARHIIWMEWLRKSVESHESVETRILGIFGFLREWMVSCDFRGCAFLNIASEVPTLNSNIRTEVMRHKNDLQLYVQQLISLLDNSHEGYNQNDRETDANMVYVLIEGAIVASQIYGEVWPVESAQNAVRNLLNIQPGRARTKGDKFHMCRVQPGC